MCSDADLLRHASSMFVGDVQGSASGGLGLRIPEYFVQRSECEIDVQNPG